MQHGRVIDTLDHGSAVSVLVVGMDEDRGERVTLYLERSNESRSVSPGDRLRWQGMFVWWTPKKAPFTDWPLYRVGTSHSGRQSFMPRIKGRECA